MADVVLTARVADAGLADRVEVTSSGTGDLARRRADGRAGGRHADRRGVRRAAGTARGSSTPVAGRASTWCSRWTGPTSPTSARRRRPDRRRRRPGPAVPRLRPRRTGRRRARPVLRWGRRLRGGAGDGGAHSRGDRAELRRRSTGTSAPDRARAVTRQPLVARRAEELLGAGGGGHGAGRRRRHLHRHPAAAQRRHDRADEDARPHAPAGFFETEAAGLRWLAEADGRRTCPRCWRSTTTA